MIAHCTLIYVLSFDYKLLVWLQNWECIKTHIKKMGLNKIEKFIPGSRWLRGYSTEFFIADLIAGITVGLTVLPQSLAYATLAGLEPQYGLYSAFVGGAIYALLGGCREVSIGPTGLKKSCLI